MADSTSQATVVDILRRDPGTLDVRFAYKNRDLGVFPVPIDRLPEGTASLNQLIGRQARVIMSSRSFVEWVPGRRRVHAFPVSVIATNPPFRTVGVVPEPSSA